MDNAVHGKVEYIAIADPANSNALVDVSGKCTNARYAFTRDDLDSTTFGQGDKTNIASLRDVTFSLDAYHDAALRTLLFTILHTDAPVSVVYGPEGNATGKQKYTANFNMTGFEIGATPTSLVGGSISFHRTGATTASTF